MSNPNKTRRSRGKTQNISYLSESKSDWDDVSISLPRPPQIAFAWLLGQTEDVESMSPSLLDAFPQEFHEERYDKYSNGENKFEVSYERLFRCNALLIQVKLIFPDGRDNILYAIIDDKSRSNEVNATVLSVKDQLIKWKPKGRRINQPHPVSHASLPFLRKHSIIPMDKMNENFPSAIYYCKLCDYHLNNILHIKAHLEEHSHIDEEQRTEERQTLLSKIPTVTKEQLSVINILINKQLEGRLTDPRKECSRIKWISVQLQDKLRKKVLEPLGYEDAKLELYGSVQTGCDENESDLNFFLDIPSIEQCDSVEAMSSILKRIYDINELEIDSADFARSITTEGHLSINFTMDNIPITMSWRTYDHLLLGTLVSKYTKIRPQTASLCRIARKWAKVCGIDNSKEKQHGLVRYAFDLMVIHFLQTEDLLPVLHELNVPEEKGIKYYIHDNRRNDQYLDDCEKIMASIDPLDRPWDLADLFIRFLRYYTTQHSHVVQIITKTIIERISTKWNKKIFQISDPFRTDNVVNFSKTFQSFFFNCFLASYLYFVLPRSSNGPLLNVKLYQKTSERKKPSRKNSSSVKPNDTESLYSCDKSNGKRTTKLDEKTINAVTSELEDQNIDFTKLVSEEDIYTSESEDEEEKYGRLMSTKTFDGILLKNLQSYDVEIDDIQQYSRRTMYRLRRVNPIRISDEVFSNLERFNLNIRHVSLRNKELEIKKSKAHAIYEQKFCSKRKQKDTISIGSDEQSLPKENHKICFEEFFIEIPAYDDLILSKEIRNLINDDKFSYSFDVPDNFTNGYTAEFKCSSCTSPKHQTDNCPLMQIPEVDIISYEKSACEKQELDKVINSDYDQRLITQEQLCDIQNVVNKIRSHLSKHIKPSIRLDIFGSLRSGFGVSSSDVDLCFRFKEDSPPAGIDQTEVLKNITKSLRKLPDLQCIQSILTAKVPIVKFECKKLKLEGDISYYNVLALYNTEMLRMYCQWAPDRLPQLGMWVKKWAKYCNIGDASKGSLSSYTFILLVIHYLQNCEEPVLPRLQEDFRTKDDKSIIIEGWDVYFFSEFYMNNWSSNKKSVSELFIGFLDYYSRFDFKTQVVQIRRRKPLTKTEKSWKKPICIEDPFDRNHNLGAGVTKKMYVYIVKNFIKSRKVFMLPDVRKRYLDTIDANDSCSIPENSFSNYADELLKACSIGSPPLDRQCRICGKIGHFAESCPMKQRKRDVKLTARHGADSTCSVNSPKKSQINSKKYIRESPHGTGGNNKSEGRPDCFKNHRRERDSTNPGSMNLK